MAGSASLIPHWITSVFQNIIYPIVQSGENITQLYYAKRRIITPEMEYVAIRENQQIEALGLKSYITPEFVRKEIAAGVPSSQQTSTTPRQKPMDYRPEILSENHTTSALRLRPV